jgi:hypothetical protein
MDIEKRIDKLEDRQDKLEDRVTSILQEISSFKPILEQIKESIDKLSENSIDKERVEKIEVKVDTRALETGNLPYEFISHGSSGWSVITKADYVYMILCDESEGKIIAKSILWIDMAKWHEFVKNRKIKKRINHIWNESIVDLLCRIDDMKDSGVIFTEEKINIELNGDS